MAQLSVSIPALVVNAQENFVTFRVLISKGDMTWSTQRRFTDFERLHAAARRWAGPSEALPELPPKHSLRVGQARFDPQFLEERRAALEGYLRRLLDAAPPEACEAVDDFLQFAQYRLREAVESMPSIPETQSLVAMLKEAVRVAEEGRGGAGGRAWARRGSEPEPDGDEGGGVALVGSPGGSGGGGEGGGPSLLPLLSSAVAALREYRGVLAGRAEDCEARTQACTSSTASLQVKLRDKRVDLEEATAALAKQREDRARECARERAQLGVLGAKVRLLGAEVARVEGEARCLEALCAAAGAAAARLRGALAGWEAGSGSGGGGGGAAGGEGGSPGAAPGSTAPATPAREAARVEDPLTNVRADVEAAEGAVPALHAASASAAPGSAVPFAAAAPQQGRARGAAAAAATVAAFPTASLAGPDLSLGLLLQAVAADSARLTELSHSASGSAAAAQPLRALNRQPSQHAPAAQPAAQATAAPPRAGAAPAPPPLRAAAATAASALSAGNPFAAPHMAGGSNPFAAAEAPPPRAANPFANAVEAPQKAPGNPF